MRLREISNPVWKKTILHIWFLSSLLFWLKLHQKKVEIPQSYMNGGFFVGQGVFCLDVKFFTPRIFFRSRIRNFTSRIFFFLDLAFGHVKDFPSIFFLTPRNPKDFVSKWFYVKDFLKIDEKAPCINETNYITVYIKFLALKSEWKSCKGAKITLFYHKFLLLVF